MSKAATSSVADVLVAIASSETERARDLALRIIRTSPDDALAAALAEHLKNDRSEGVYDDPRGFEEFIDNGGNPDLYASVINMLAQRHRDVVPTAVVDIGCGDGRVTLATTLPTSVVHLVEPSPALADLAMARLSGRPGATNVHNKTLAEFLDTTSGSWDLAQATFALHNLEPNERKEQLRALRSRTSRLLLVEFDVPDFDDRSLEHATYAAQRYVRGFHEYRDYPTVRDGFLLPVLLGQFDAQRARHTFEQSATSWKQELLGAGWSGVEATPVASYWWADAVLFDAAA